MSEILPILQAVDRLNGWVRSESFRRAWSGKALRRHIYQAKAEAIRLSYFSATTTSHRPFATLATCRDCSGSGKYTDFHGRTWPHCRACGNSGNVRLRFVESRILLLHRQFVWHTPSHLWPLSSEILGPETTVMDFMVNAVGTELPLDDAAHDLLLIDEQLPPRYRDLHPPYTLYLGKVDESCAHCGRAVTQEEANRGRCTTTVARAEFSFIACPECENRLTTAQIFSVCIPVKLLEPPHVLRWVEKNMVAAMRQKGGQAA